MNHKQHKQIVTISRGTVARISIVLLLLLGQNAGAMIDGITGPSFNLSAKAGHISVGDPSSHLMWSYTVTGQGMQYPGPTLIVNQNDVVTVNLTNELSVPVSILFPGQFDVRANGGSPGLLTREALPGGTVTYRFRAINPGTYLYQSGTRMDIQVEMGLVGALLVQPAIGPHHAYNHMDTMYDHETLFLLTEMDPQIHFLVEIGMMHLVDSTAYHPVIWMINGRAAPDTMAAAFTPLLPTQPYDCMPRIHPGETLLLRLIGAGRDMHPFHVHGNNASIIARDARLLQSPMSMDVDLAESNFTVTVAPGETTDALWTWTGENLGWDIYGHPPDDVDNPPTGNFPGPEDIDHNGDGILDTTPLEPNEYAPDHGKPFPVLLPNQEDVTFGIMYSGSPFLGAFGSLPPGEGGFNPTAGYFFMWHSHNEKEMVNNDIFPGGMMTMLIVEPAGVVIE